MIYESKPFIVGDGQEIVIEPIEINQRKREEEAVTRGVLLKNGVPAVAYILKVYRVGEDGRRVYLGFTITDSFGQFVIPISSKMGEFVVKIYSQKEETENIELIIK